MDKNTGTAKTEQAENSSPVLGELFIHIEASRYKVRYKMLTGLSFVVYVRTMAHELDNCYLSL